MKFILDFCLENAKFLYFVYLLPAKGLESTWDIHWGFWKFSELQGTQIYLIFSCEVCEIMHLPFVSDSMKREYNGTIYQWPLPPIPEFCEQIQIWQMSNNHLVIENQTYVDIFSAIIQTPMFKIKTQC